MFVIPFTPAYRDLALGARDSVEDHYHICDLYAYPDLGSWQANVRAKPKILLTIMDQVDMCVLMDADARMICSPTMLLNLLAKHPIVCAEYEPERRRFGRYSSAIIGVRYEEDKTLPFLRYWQGACDHAPATFAGDQEAFNRTIEVMGLHPGVLPSTYLHTEVREDTVFVHSQASRIHASKERIARAVKG